MNMEGVRVLVLMCTVFAFGNCGRLDFLRVPKHDGIARACKLTSENFTSIIGELEKTTVVFFKQTEGHGSTRPEVEAEVLSQVFSNSGIRFCSAPQDLRQGEPGDVSIYTRGRKLFYYGTGSASAVLSFLIKVDTNSVRVITGKLDKIAFDAVQEPKLVGLFMNGTVDFLAYQEASRIFSPSIHFYAVFDRTVAKHLRLDVVGDIHLFKPMHKTSLVLPVNPASLVDLQGFIQEQRGAVFTKVTEQNLNDPLHEDPNRVLIAAIADQTSSLGGYLYRLLSKTVRNSTNSTSFNRLNILWIEPELFPAVYLSGRSVNTPGFPTQIPSLGSVNGGASAWFDLSLLNVTADKTADEQNLILIKTWIEAMLTNTATLSSGGTGVQTFAVQPSSQTVEEGADFTLECKVNNGVGDCLWLHNGQNLGFNMLRYKGLYMWAVSRDDPTAAQDCSLKVTGAQVGQQDGQWVCEMTGNAENPTITSSPAQIVVRAKNSKVEL